MFSSSQLLGTVLAASSLVNAATRQFFIEASWGTGSPDGFERPMILINGTSPGPALIVDQGDDVEFFFQNNLDRVSTIHFHGIEMLNTPWSDGVPGQSQKPTPAGSSWLYKWTATEYGAFWYHAHYQGQVSDGFYGALYIRPRPEETKPFAGIPGDQAAMACAEEDSHLTLVSDWQHVTNDEIYELQMEANIDIFCSQSILFNGQGRVHCLSEEQQRAALAPPFQSLYAEGGPLAGTFLSPSGCAPFVPFTQRPGPNFPERLPESIRGCRPTQTDLHDFRVDPTKQFASFHLISASSILAPVISLDEHDMWVYAVDGRYIEPYRVQSLQIFNGERYSVMVPLTQGSGTYTLRANHFGFNQLIGGFASVTYEAGSGATCNVNGGGGGGAVPGGRPGGRPGDTPSIGGGGAVPGGRPGGRPGDTPFIGGGQDGGVSGLVGRINDIIARLLGRGRNANRHSKNRRDNENRSIDCGIPGWQMNKPYCSQPDPEPVQVPAMELPHVPTAWDWHGPMPGPQEPASPAAPENPQPPTYNSPAMENSPVSPQLSHTHEKPKSCPSGKSRRALSYAHRADQFRSTTWKRQEDPTNPMTTTTTPYITYGGFPTSADVIQLQFGLLRPFKNVPPAREVSQTFIFGLSRTTSPYLWRLGGEEYPAHPTEYAEDNPLLYFPESAEANNQNLVIRTQNDTWVDLIFTVPEPFGPPHPMHKHSNKAYVIGRGLGAFPYASVAEAAAAMPENFNFENPILRDGYTTAPSAGQSVWLAVRYHVVNPGAFMLHCHNQMHLAGGMALAILDDIGLVGEFPEEYATADSNGIL